jgi:hypothetical protein
MSALLRENFVPAVGDTVLYPVEADEEAREDQTGPELSRATPIPFCVG